MQLFQKSNGDDVMASLKIDKNLIARNIKNTRLENGLNQEDFGKLFTPHADKSIVSRWERGKSVPSAERLKIIAKKANMSVRYFTTGKKMYSDLTSDEKKELENEAKKYMQKEIDRKNQELYDSLSDEKSVTDLSTSSKILLGDVVNLIQLVRGQSGENGLMHLDLILSSVINARINNFSDKEYASMMKINKKELDLFTTNLKLSEINEIDFDIKKVNDFK